MTEHEIDVRVSDGEITTFVVHAEGAGPFPVAVLYMDGIGYREQIKENARRFAADGYYCVVPDLYYRVGNKVSFDPARLRDERFRDQENERLMTAVATVTPERVVAATRAVFAAIESDPAAADGPKVCVGYCLGARCVVRASAALADEFVAGAGIHPGALVTDEPDSPHLDLPAVRGELYIAFAEFDRSVSTEGVDRFRAEFEAAGVRGVVERLPGVTHGYAMADLPMYDRAASEEHFRRTLELWRRNLSPQPVTT
jgi:carboxymethylenebutenolidase